MSDSQITLVSNDGRSFQVDEEVALQSVTLKNMIDDTGAEGPIPLPTISGGILERVIDYCKYHASNTTPNAETKAWDDNFVRVEQEVLFNLILAANFLDIKPLLDHTCMTVANMIKGKTPEEIRETFNISNDFTEDEEIEVRRENAWCEDR